MARKNIILCSDGTGNTINKGRGTNVWKLYESIDLGLHRRILDGEPKEDGCFEQIAFYDDGVGTSGFKIPKIIGGAFGWGLKRNVLDLYRALCSVYQPGDRIYLFGFSRGAYTVRLLAGMIIACGVIDRKKWDDLPTLKRLAKDAYSAFRQGFFATSPNVSEKSENEGGDGTSGDGRADGLPDTDAARFQRENASDNGKIEIEFIGVWDTVAAIGLPFKELTYGYLNRWLKFMFPDRLLNKSVKKGCHALAIDDERLSFHPILWDEEGEEPGSDRIEQVWFPGVHSNVGGGYPKQGISLLALDWMMQKAEEAGLQFLDSERERYRSMQNCHDWLYNSREGLAVYYRYQPRDILGLSMDAHCTPAKIHVSTLERIASATQGYAPILLPNQFDVVNYDDLVDKRDGEKIKGFVSGLRDAVLYGDLKKFVTIRRAAYYFFLALTIWILVFGGFIFDPDKVGTLYFPERLFDLVVKLVSAVPVIGDLLVRVAQSIFYNWGYLLFILIYTVSVWGIATYARNRIHAAASRFWRKRVQYPWTVLLSKIGGPPEPEDIVEEDETESAT